VVKRFYNFQKNDVESCIFIITRLCTSSGRNSTLMSKCPIPGNGLKTFKCTCALSPLPTEIDAFTHNIEWIYLSHGFEYHIFTFARRFYAFLYIKTVYHRKKTVYHRLLITLHLQLLGVVLTVLILLRP